MIRILAATSLVFLASSAQAQTVYPIDRAEILSGSRFDFKVEFSGRVSLQDVRVTVNGADYVSAFGRAAEFVEREDGKEQSALILRDASLPKPGGYRIECLFAPS